MEKIKPYNKYKKSSILWLGNIPEHWEETDVRKIFIDNKVKNEGSKENNLLTLSYGKIKSKDINTVDGLLPASFASYQVVDKGDIILRLLDLQNDKNSLRVGYVDKKGIITSAYTGLKTKGNINSKYYYYLLHFLDTIKHFYNCGSGVRQSMGFSELGKEKIILQTIEEQIAISKFLDYKLPKIDRFISKKKQLIKLLNEQKAGIINHAITKGIDPNTTMKDSGIEWLGNIPEHWEVMKLKYVADCFPSNIDKHTKEDEQQVRLCNYTDVYKNDFIINNMNLMIASASVDQIEKFSLLKGDVIITKDSETANDIAVPAFVKEDLENVVCGYHLSVLRPSSKLVGEYLFRTLQCKSINIQFELCSNGVTRVGLGVYDMKKARIPIPPINEQKLIISHIEKETSQLNQLIQTIEKEIALTQEYRTALIAEAVTGKVDVRAFVIPTVSEQEELYEEIEEELDMVAEDAESYENE